MNISQYMPFVSFWLAGFACLGFLIVVAPLGVYGFFFERRVRADGPEPPASPAEVTALRVFFAATAASLLLLLSAASVLTAMY